MATVKLRASEWALIKTEALFNDIELPEPIDSYTTQGLEDGRGELVYLTFPVGGYAKPCITGRTFIKGKLQKLADAGHDVYMESLFIDAKPTLCSGTFAWTKRRKANGY